jgi:hypothetical protein
MRGLFGFDQGFDTYDDKRRVGTARTLPKVKKWVDFYLPDCFNK